MNGSFLAALRRTVSDGATELSSARKRKGNNKKKGKQCGTLEEQRCAADAAVCQQVLLAECGSNEQCVADNTPCCETCSADGFLACVLNNSNAGRTTIARFG